MAKKTPARKFKDIFQRWTSGSTPEERATGEKMAEQWLKRHGKSRLDSPVILAQAAADEAAAAPPPPPSDPRDAAPAEPIDPHETALSLVCGAFKTFLALDS